MCTCEQLWLDSTSIHRRPLTSLWSLWRNAVLVDQLSEICIRAKMELIGEIPTTVLQCTLPHEHVVLSCTVNADISCYSVTIILIWITLNVMKEYLRYSLSVRKFIVQSCILSEPERIQSAYFQIVYWPSRIYNRWVWTTVSPCPCVV